MKKRLIIGNWKMYVETPQAAAAYAKSLRLKIRGLTGLEVSLAPAYTLIPTVSEILKRSAIAVGAQGVSRYHADAHTGDVSAAMLKASGATFIIIGHSERRAMGEDDEIIRRQILEAAARGLSVVLCVGERERDINGDYFSFIKTQLSTALVGLDKKVLAKMVVAYEPVWAIGKHAADAMKPYEVQEAVIFIKKTLTQVLEPAQALKIPILYGGSVEAENAQAFFTEGGVQGLLVGHASADIETFLPLLKAVRVVAKKTK